jgi:hypothetical protein
MPDCSAYFYFALGADFPTYQLPYQLLTRYQIGSDVGIGNENVGIGSTILMKLLYKSFRFLHKIFLFGWLYE